MARAYYNEIDPYAASWLRHLIAAGHIAPGDVDERSIVDVRPADLAGYRQCHFFAGIGIWSLALRRSGWGDDRAVWTGSCPCQPFSAVGKGEGVEDPRHLWPTWYRLIAECSPDVVFGEQVASKDGLAWLDLVYADLEGSGYAVGAADLCAAGVGAPHIRQRLWFVGARDRDGDGVLVDSVGERGRGGQSRREDAADAGVASQTRKLDDPMCARAGRDAGANDGAQGGRESTRIQAGHQERGDVDAGAARQLADGESLGLSGRPDDGDEGRRECASRQGCEVGELAHCDGAGTERRRGNDAEAARLPQDERQSEHRADVPQRSGADHDGRGTVRGDGLRSDDRAAGPVNGVWRAADWLLCRDGKWRAAEPGTFPLDHGHPARVGKLRAYGNAICPEVASEFIGAYLDVAAAR